MKKTLTAYTLIGTIMATTTLSSCSLIQNRTANLWFYTFSTGPAETRDSLLTPASFLDLNPDGNYTRDFGSFEYGRWNLKEGKLYLTNQKNTTYVIPMNTGTGKDMQLTLHHGMTASFESQALRDTKPDQDPFSKENNEWRIPATQPETDAAIRKRLYNHCRFWEMYFTWALNNGLTVTDVRSTPSPVKIYGNGFGLKHFDELSATWKSYFFNEDDCRKADHMIKDTFRSHNIAWAHTENKFKLFIGAFQQLEQFLK